jgi:hypothetical protein
MAGWLDPVDGVESPLQPMEKRSSPSFSMAPTTWSPGWRKRPVLEATPAQVPVQRSPEHDDWQLIIKVVARPGFSLV